MDLSLVKIRVALPEHEDFGGEGLWAAPLGEGRYELRNAPFFASDLNWGDVVQCAERRGARPVFESVVSRSGHRTLRVVFLTEDLADRRGVLAEVESRGAKHEHALGLLYAVDVPPPVDFRAVWSYLEGREAEGVLTFGTGGGRARDAAGAQLVPPDSGSNPSVTSG